ncbi:hypothetical protein PQJ75_07145 [Rhodoplanes sp. TEM]|uniref:O-antigen ligase-related domain-containing protein n=1 Tax=Rhodoplanes tepidamans TaxID=200616 RepID=A0ABT5J4A3_RHOTP|nr:MULTISPECIES: O-antigen ligase family protein [Rhodoplanes]MDC7784472.1 hypothetical protein [Rhodoplanes tepidamans]MDC7983502.1 hypothetical protein [Rhodoplanes sp. TEM]MDQ0356980.1 O-antigen ligase [Rhodoplanes tepidamans]
MAGDPGERSTMTGAAMRPRRAVVLAWLREALTAPETAALGYLVTFAPMVLTNRLSAANFLFFAALLPLSIPRIVALASRPDGRAVLRRLPGTVVAASAAYVTFLTIAAAVQPDATWRLVRKDSEYGLAIVGFVAATGVLVATGTRFLRLAVLGLAGAVAASALLNVAAFLPSFPTDPEDLLAWRLVAVLGMPEYANATNISATYAVLLVVAAAAASGLTRSWLERSVLIVATGVLGVAVILTQSRGAVLGVACGLVVLAATLSRRARIALLVGATLCLAGLAVTPLGPDWVQRGVSYRPAVWAAYLDKAAERPLLGYGPHADIGVTIAPDVPIGQPHNLILSGQIRGGIGAALAMAALLAAGLFWSVRLVRAGGSVVPLCGFVTMTVCGMVDYNLLITRPAWPWLTFWLPIGFAAGAELAVRAGADPAVGDAGTRR